MSSSRYEEIRKVIERLRGLCEPGWRNNTGLLQQAYLDTIEAFVDDAEAGRIDGSVTTKG